MEEAGGSHASWRTSSPVVLAVVGSILMALLAAFAWPEDDTASTTEHGWRPLAVVPATAPTPVLAAEVAIGLDPVDLGGWPDVDRPHVPAVSGRSVLVVGDSLTKAARQDLMAELYGAGAALVRVTAQNGAPIAWAADRIPEQGHHDVVVVAAGTNDAESPWSDAVVAEIRRVIAGAGRATCTIWVLPTPWRHPEFAGTRSSHAVPAAEQTIAALRAVVVEAGWWAADWSTVAAGRPELHEGDGIHHTAAGRAAYATFVLDSIASGCAD